MKTTLSNRRTVVLFSVLAVLIIGAIYFASFLPTADWYATFDPAARGVFSGHLPYEQVGYVYPPWAVVPLLPIVLFPPTLAHGIMFVVSALLLIGVAWHLRANPIATAAFLLSPTAIGALLVNNIDPFIISGILLPPVVGLFLLVIKPQIGVGVAVYYAYDTWRKEKFWGVVRVFAPVGILYLLSAILFPVWIERMMRNPQVIWNRSLFPYAIPLGIFFMWVSFKCKNAYFAMAASLFFAPYHSLYSYIAMQIALLHQDVEKVVRRDVLQVALTIFFWVITLYFKL